MSTSSKGTQVSSDYSTGLQPDSFDFAGTFRSTPQIRFVQRNNSRGCVYYDITCLFQHDGRVQISNARPLMANTLTRKAQADARLSRTRNTVTNKFTPATHPFITHYFNDVFLCLADLSFSSPVIRPHQIPSRLLPPSRRHALPSTFALPPSLRAVLAFEAAPAVTAASALVRVKVDERLLPACSARAAGSGSAPRTALVASDARLGLALEVGVLQLARLLYGFAPFAPFFDSGLP